MMDMTFSQEWLRKVAKEEEDVRFSVGGWVSELEEQFGPELTGTMTITEGQATPGDLSETILDEADPKHVQSGNVFGQFLNLARRERGLSVQALAQTIGMNPYDLLRLEDGKELPELRIISRVAKVFDVPPRKLAQAAGVVIADKTTAQAALAFAASSSTKPLEPEQKEALHEFIRALAGI
jgi:transcriptional regulator with XRE-family HTH domain